MFAAVNSPWSANDEGQAIAIMVEVSDKDEIPEKLGRALAMEAHLSGGKLTDEDLESLLTTIDIMD